MRFNKNNPRAYLFICTIIIQSLLTAQAKNELDSSHINYFLMLISNDWKGTAVQTPIGPVTYNIKFLKNSSGHVTGAAYLSRSTHYWDFYRNSDELNLKFLSTFAGNDQPIIFKSYYYSNEGFEFNSTSRNDVKVIIKPETQKMTIRIFLRDQAHVNIELEKMEQP